MRISLIAAVAANGVIGRNNKLPWHLSTDLKRFKSLTMGHHLIMGRKTFDEIGRKPLPGRPNIVISRSAIATGGIQTATTLDEAFSRVAATEDEVFVIGGGEIFRQVLHRADRMYITQVHAEIEGDTFFPEYDPVNEWRLIDREDFESDAKNDYPFSFLTYERVGAADRAEEALLPE
jgi:dihydrofolate reductase